MITRPKEIFAYLRELKTIKKIRAGKTEFSYRDFIRFIGICQRQKAKGKQSKEYRAFMCKIAKEFSPKFTFTPTDYSKPKASYDKFVAEGGITDLNDVKKGDWITCIRNWDCPIKGDTYASYYSNGNSAGNIDEAYEIDKMWPTIDTAGVVGNGSGLILGQFRLSTQEEIDAKDGIVYKRELKKINDYAHTKIKQIIELNDERRALKEKYGK